MKWKGEKALRDAYGEALVELGERNKDIVVLDADLSSSTRTSKFAKRFPNRFFNMGISEQDMMGTAAGLASCGKIPFVSTFAVFASGKAYDQVRLAICYSKLNVKIVASHGGISVGEDGASHQSLEDIALMRVIPNMVVIVPADAVETRRVIFKIAEYKGPVYVRLARPKFPIIFDGTYEFEIGKHTVVREGRDATVVACGLMVSEALIAAETLEKEGISVEVINASTIKPFDAETVLKSARKTGAVVTAEEHSIIGGLGSATAEVLVENYPVPMERVGVKDVFGESGPARQLLEKYGLTAKHIADAVKRVVRRK